MEWISVEERLPDDGERVLIANGSRIFLVVLKNGHWLGPNAIASADEMGHLFWMPLPPVPEEVKPK